MRWANPSLESSSRWTPLATNRWIAKCRFESDRRHHALIEQNRLSESALSAFEPE